MATECIAQVTFDVQGLRQPVVARFDQPYASSDGGAVLLKVLDDRLGVTERLAASLIDDRQPGKVQHEVIELVRQRVYGITCGYADWKAWSMSWRWPATCASSSAAAGCWRARMLSKASGQTEHLYGETRYAARKWPRKRRVIIKAEVVRHPGRDPKSNPRFVVTNLADAPEAVCAIYCGRGDMENRLKELHQGLAPNSSVYPTSHAISFDQYKIWVISRQGAGGPPRGSASGDDDPAPGRRPDGMPHIASERCIVPQPIEPVGAAPGRGSRWIVWIRGLMRIAGRRLASGLEGRTTNVRW